ncbi:uncharacterized protein LOC130048742 [Ostrea edulis]|uniref:uncharacterized protein LOC130048742 n=1 Tax=Ostrea edulis TaxID=37623 RepID=UPI0024AF9AB3|nr:uncharacterized protein LOC130048742 [Ostrea edulis]
MPNVDSILRKIGQWKYLAMTDLTKAFYQIPLARGSMKYCGVVTPFRGVRVYTRSAMGMPGSETALEELTCRVLGDLLEEGIVVKLADDLYCGADTPDQLLENFSRVLTALNKCNIKLSASKTVIAPLRTTILGWIWQQGTLSASPHRTATLASCEMPSKDTLWIVTDGALRKPGIGATLYISRGDNKLLLAGFFSAKLRKCQVSWLPCDVEALSIGTAVKHYSPYIVQSLGPCCVLTDSKPCVMAYDKLCRGEFSASPRVYTFLSTVSRYQVSVRHVAGAAILPSDHSSRNAPECIEPNCQICSFVAQSMGSVVRSTSVSDILNGSTKLPFTTRSVWLAIQPECSDLRRTCSHLRQGTRPSRKATNIKDIKRYLSVATIASDGLLVVKRNDPFVPSKELIIIPRSVLHGLLTSIHLQLAHPSANQMKTIMKRFFFALDMDKEIDSITSACSQCSALQKIPNFIIDQTTSDPPETIGGLFAADVMKREKQLVFIMRECISSYTTARITEDEKAETLRTAVIQSCIELRPMDGPFAVIRTDPAPGFQALVNDKILQSHRISVEIGRFKNANKNPIAERAVQELREHILRIDPTARAVSSLVLSLAVASVNCTIRQGGLSAREMLTQRDQFTNRQLPISDRECILQKHLSRNANHPSSEKSKAPIL